MWFFIRCPRGDAGAAQIAGLSVRARNQNSFDFRLIALSDSPPTNAPPPSDMLQTTAAAAMTWPLWPNSSWKSLLLRNSGGAGEMFSEMHFRPRCWAWCNYFESPCHSHCRRTRSTPNVLEHGSPHGPCLGQLLFQAPLTLDMLDFAHKFFVPFWFACAKSVFFLTWLLIHLEQEEAKGHLPWNNIFSNLVSGSRDAHLTLTQKMIWVVVFRSSYLFKLL